MKPMKRRKMCIDLPIEIYHEMEEKADRRHLDKTNYFIYLIKQDKDDLFSQKAADALENVLESTEYLLEKIPEDHKVRPFVVQLGEGVNDLCQYLR